MRAEIGVKTSLIYDKNHDALRLYEVISRDLRKVMVRYGYEKIDA